MDLLSGPGIQGEETRQGFPGAVASRLKRLHRRFGVWKPAGAALLLAITLTALYTSFATAERGGGTGGTVDSTATRLETSGEAPAAAESAPGERLRGSLRAALRRGLGVRLPAGEGER